MFWGYSSVGRAPALQAGCQRFESAYLHLRVSLLQQYYIRKFADGSTYEVLKNYYDAEQLSRILAPLGFIKRARANF